MTKITYPDRTTDLYSYDFQSGSSAGKPSLDLRQHTDRLGRVSTYNYNADRRLTVVTEPIAASVTRTTSHDYYENGVLKDITDANGNVTHWDIDIQSRPTSKTYGFGTANAEKENYAYAVNTSRLVSVTDALSQVKSYTYALDDRITDFTYRKRESDAQSDLRLGLVLSTPILDGGRARDHELRLHSYCHAWGITLLHRGLTLHFVWRFPLRSPCRQGHR